MLVALVGSGYAVLGTAAGFGVSSVCIAMLRIGLTRRPLPAPWPQFLPNERRADRPAR
ncbi:MAG: hypothetical protein ACRD0J_13655 [Acidimicrobiales bacterium]